MNRYKQIQYKYYNDCVLFFRRWLENIQPAERALELLPHLSAFITAAKSGKITEPQNKSFETVVKATRDPLLAAKLHFFLYVAREVCDM